MRALFWVARILLPLAGVGLTSFVFPKILLGSASFPGGFRLRAIALELVRTPDDFKEILTEYPANEVRADLAADTYKFIPLYTVLFVVAAMCLGAAGTRFEVVVAIASAAVAMAGFDLLENFRTETALAGDPVLQTTVDAIRHA